MISPRSVWLAPRLMTRLCCAGFHASAQLASPGPVRARRATLTVPGNDERKLEKSAGLGADCVLVDLEDGVAVNMKETARNNFHQLLNSSLDFGRSELAVRINDLTTGLAEEDLEAAMTGRRVPSMVCATKVQSTEEMDWYFDNIRSRIPSTHKETLALKINVETALGFTFMPQILKRGKDLSDERVRLDGVTLGYDDFSASVGCHRSPEMYEMRAVRQLFVVYAKAFQLQAYDAVFTDFKDDEGLRKQSLEAFSFGFNGKHVIHPNQIEIVHRCFTPSQERIEWAKQLVTEFLEHQKNGQGAFAFRGRMIDMPIYLQAKSIVDMINNIDNS